MSRGSSRVQTERAAQSHAKDADVPEGASPRTSRTVGVNFQLRLDGPRHSVLYVPRACYSDSVGSWSFFAPPRGFGVMRGPLPQLGRGASLVGRVPFRHHLSSHTFFGNSWLGEQEELPF